MVLVVTSGVARQGEGLIGRRRPLSRLFDDRRGFAIMEFAIFGPVLMLLVLAIVDAVWMVTSAMGPIAALHPAAPLVSSGSRAMHVALPANGAGAAWSDVALPAVVATLSVATGSAGD
jgi:hypothetical protein